MMLRSGVYVRARDPDGKFSTILAEDLDERSFRVFILAKLARLGLLTAVTDQLDEAKHLTTPMYHPKEDT